MPTYEYKCTNDGSTFDIWQEVGSPAPPCPDCGAPTKKVFAPPRVIFKGSGFYVTDKRAETNDAKAKDAKPAETKTDGDASSETSGAASGAASGEAKPAEKSEAKTATKTESKTE